MIEKEQIYPTSVRLPAQLKADLEEIAKTEHRSISNMSLVIVEKYINEYKKDH